MTALLFVGPKNGPLRRSNFQDHWRKATAEAGIPDLHFHDLRHTGNTWAAETGATLRDLMDRMGHATTRAALIYLHRTVGRDKKIADALSKLVEDSRDSKSAETNSDAANDRPANDRPANDGPANNDATKNDAANDGKQKAEQGDADGKQTAGQANADTDQADATINEDSGEHRGTEGHDDPPGHHGPQRKGHVGGTTPD